MLCKLGAMCIVTRQYVLVVSDDNASDSVGPKAIATRLKAPYAVTHNVRVRTTPCPVNEDVCFDTEAFKQSVSYRQHHHKETKAELISLVLLNECRQARDCPSLVIYLRESTVETAIRCSST